MNPMTSAEMMIDMKYVMCYQIRVLFRPAEARGIEFSNGGPLLFFILQIMRTIDGLAIRKSIINRYQCTVHHASLPT